MKRINKTSPPRVPKPKFLDFNFLHKNSSNILVFCCCFFRSALQTLHKVSSKAREQNYFLSGLSHDWVSYYEQRIESDRSCLNEWHAMDNLESKRPPSPDSVRTKWVDQTLITVRRQNSRSGQQPEIIDRTRKSCISWKKSRVAFSSGNFADVRFSWRPRYVCGRTISIHEEYIYIYKTTLPPSRNSWLHHWLVNLTWCHARFGDLLMRPLWLSMRHSGSRAL